jgi:Abortive infection alpha
MVDDHRELSARAAGGARPDGGARLSPRAAANLARDIPGVARVFASLYWRTLSWTVGSSVNVGAHVAKRTLSGDSPVAIAHDATAELRAIAGRLLGSAPDDSDVAARREAEKDSASANLRALGTALLQQSADVGFDEGMHPAYVRILSEMSPDEARILRLLTQKGPQPTVDVRTNRPFGIGSELVASGLSMIGEHAGCRDVERTSAYLNNLFRLGLVWFSRESVDPQRYQLVEAQPKVVGAMKRAGRSPKTVHRSINLTAFGLDFCRTCLPLGDLNSIEGTVVEQPGRPDPAE